MFRIDIPSGYFHIDVDRGYAERKGGNACGYSVLPYTDDLSLFGAREVNTEECCVLCVQGGRISPRIYHGGNNELLPSCVYDLQFENRSLDHLAPGVCEAGCNRVFEFHPRVLGAYPRRGRTCITTCSGVLDFLSND